MEIVVVVDMQVGLLAGSPKHDLPAVLDRINALSRAVRGRNGRVIWIRHCGPVGDDFEPGTSGWEFLPQLDHHCIDIVVEKTLNDPFAGTRFKSILEELAPSRLIITGWATDFCVDATVRSAVSNNLDVVIAVDAHTLSDRPHLRASDVIEHHHAIWRGLLTKRSISLATTAEIVSSSRTD